jgi:hypothetical protein
MHKQRCATACEAAAKNVKPQNFCFGIGIELISEDSRVIVFEREVKGLGRKITDYIDSVASPQGNDTIMFDDVSETVHNAIVFVVAFKTFVFSLGLNKEFNSLDWGTDSLGDDSRQSSGQKVMYEVFVMVLGHTEIILNLDVSLKSEILILILCRLVQMNNKI